MIMRPALIQMVPIPVHVINFSLEMEHIVKVGKKQILSLAIACFYLLVPGRGEKNPLDAEQGGGLRPGPQLKRCD